MRKSRAVVIHEGLCQPRRLPKAVTHASENAERELQSAQEARSLPAPPKFTRRYTAKSCIGFSMSDRVLEIGLGKPVPLDFKTFEPRQRDMFCICFRCRTDGFETSLYVQSSATARSRERRYNKAHAHVSYVGAQRFRSVRMRKVCLA